MTDAVKINIQQEVAVLQNKVKYLEDENNKLLHDLEVMNNEKMNLLMIKDKYLARTQEWVELQAKLDAVKASCFLYGDFHILLVHTDIGT